jgi:hypothetical protein
LSFDIGGFNLEVQQVNLFSLQRSEMFIATNPLKYSSLREERDGVSGRPVRRKLLRSYGARA